MAVAWTGSKLGRAVGDVTIRDQVVLTATLPRFLLNGDRGTMHLELDNVEGGAGEYKIAARSEGVNAVGNAAAQAQRLHAKERKSLNIPLPAPEGRAADVGGRIGGARRHPRA